MSEETPVVVDKTLRPETKAQRNAEARIGAGDIAQARARFASLSTPGRILDEDGKEIVVSPAVTRAMGEAKKL